MDESNLNAQCSSSLPSRRKALAVGGATAASVAAMYAARDRLAQTEPVFIARGQTYDSDLTTTIRDGLLASGVDAAWFQGRRVLLKPNMVEPSRSIPHMTTHPAVIVAAADVFRGWGAAVSVGEAPGHVRDSQMALIESGVGEALRDAELEFADLNYQETAWRKNRSRFCDLDGFYLPRSVAEADVVVSMPKMKTHHWVGVTCSMKNLYGVLPGIKYGWPKNVLHHNGIPETVADINSCLPNTLAIVDGIDCMEGDGPILGSLKHMGLIVAGQNLPAVDATVARIMGIEPRGISYLGLIENRLGPLNERRIVQRGESWQQLVSPFEILDEPHLRHLRSGAPDSLFS